MENKKGNGGLILIIILLLLIIIGLFGYIYYDKFIKKPEVDCTKCNVETKEETKEKSLLKDSSKPVVYNNKEYTNLDVPYINIDSDDAENINKSISTYVDKMDEGISFGEYNTLSYEYFENDNVLSVRIMISTMGSTKYYQSYNIDVKTGKTVTNKELCKIADIKETEVGNLAFDIYIKDAEKNGFLDTYKTQHIYGDEYTSVYDGTKMIFDSTKLEDYDMYLNKDGNLCVISEVYLIAGPEKNNYVFNLSKNIYEK